MVMSDERYGLSKVWVTRESTLHRLLAGTTATWDLDELVSFLFEQIPMQKVNLGGYRSSPGTGTQPENPKV